MAMPCPAAGCCRHAKSPRLIDAARIMEAAKHERAQASRSSCSRTCSNQALHILLKSSSLKAALLEHGAASAIATHA